MRSRRRVSLLGETTSKTPNRTPRDDREVRSTSETRRILPADRVPGPSIDCSFAAIGTPAAVWSAFVKVYGGQLENRQKIPFKAGSLTRTRKKQPFKRAGAQSRRGRWSSDGLRTPWRSRPCTSRWCSPPGSCGATAASRCVRDRETRRKSTRPRRLSRSPRVARPARVAAIAASPDAIVDLEPARNPQISSTTDPSDRQRAQVHLCGSFTNWLETVPMAPEPAPNGGSVFAVVCNLPPGYHQYKFIVDGEWRHDENQAFIQDPLGNVNNWCEHRPARASIPRARPTPRGDKTHPAKPPAPRKQQPSLFSRWHAVTSPPGH